jgi:hypothetical protein
MSIQDEPDDNALCVDDAELRAFRRIASALERGDIDELAAALDPAWPAPVSDELSKEK